MDVKGEWFGARQYIWLFNSGEEHCYLEVRELMGKWCVCVYVFVCACVHACVRARVHVHACVRACVCVCVCTHILLPLSRLS